MDAQRLCTRCKGTGELPPIPHIDRAPTRCYSCEGRGTFDAPDVADIMAAIVSTRGPNKGRLRKARPSYDNGARPYYVWRMARFHGGADVTLPVMAGLDVTGDPYVEILDLLADEVAKRAFGTDRAAAHRWGPLIGAGALPDEPGLPPTAYPCGPERMDT